MSFFPLGHHSSLTSIDPLGVCESDEDHVSHAELLSELLRQAQTDLQGFEASALETSQDDGSWTERLQQLIQDIAYSLHGDHKLQADGLSDILTAGWLSSVQEQIQFRKCLFNSARQLAQLFPDGQLPLLSAHAPSFVCTTVAMDALLAHMLLGTLQIPLGNTWGRPGFWQYYDGTILPAVRNTAPAYLQTIVAHFAEGGYQVTRGAGQAFSFQLATGAEMPRPSDSETSAVDIPVTLVNIPCDPSSKDNAFVLVAANAQPGPGAGGTHEERLVGQSPALAVASLLTPVLKSDQAVVTSSFPVHASWRGHGRTAEMLSILPPSERPQRRYIIADALPLDLSHRQADLRVGNVQREVRKLYAAFAGAKKAAASSGEPLIIEMPPWGCGAFGGSLQIKIPCMMMAAGLAGLRSENLELLVPKDGGFDLSPISRGKMTVCQLYTSLTHFT